MRLGTYLFALVPLICLAGCQDTLIYGERTAFNLAIEVNDNPKTPIQVNAGLKREVVEVAPPQSTDNSGSLPKPTDDAVNSFSGFAMSYEEGTTPLSGTLAIRTQFATGAAADALAGSPRAVAEVVKADFQRNSDFVSEENIGTRSQLLSAINDLDPKVAVAAACDPVVDPVLTPNPNLNMSEADCANGTNEARAKYILTRRVLMSDPSTFPAWRMRLNVSG